MKLQYLIFTVDGLPEMDEAHKSFVQEKFETIIDWGLIMSREQALGRCPSGWDYIVQTIETWFEEGQFSLTTFLDSEFQARTIIEEFKKSGGSETLYEIEERLFA